MGSQAAAQGFALFTQVVGRFGVAYSQLCQCGLRGFFRQVAGGFDCILELGA